MRSSLGLVVVLALVGRFGPVFGQASVPTDLVGSTLGLTEVEVVSLAVPAVVEVGTIVEVPIAGALRTLELRPHSVRGPGFRVVEVNGTSESEIAPGGPVTFRGRVLGERTSAVAGALLEDGFRAQVLLEDGSRHAIEPLAGRVPGATTDQYAVYPTAAVIPRGICGVPDGEIGGPPTGLVGGSGCGGDACLVEIACDADFEFFQAHASSTSRTQNRIEMILNIVSLQYERDVQITIRIGTVLVRTSEPDPYTETDEDLLLVEFQDHWNANHAAIARDTVHLFTGRDIDGTTIGIAYVGQVCNLAQAYGISQADFSMNFAEVTDLVAHELGHNWDATHCFCGSPAYTMNGGLTGANRFRDFGSPNSVLDITTYRDSVGCLDGAVHNDSCRTPQVIWYGTTLGDNTFATQDGASSCAPSATLDVWYAYTPGGSGMATIDTEGSTGLTDTVISVHDGCAGAASEIACDDQGGTGNLSSITLPVTAGTLYLIRVSGWSGTTGDFQLNIAGPTCAVPANDDVANAFHVAPGEYRGTTASATNDGDATCGSSSNSPDVWYHYVAREEGWLILDTCGSDFDTVLTVYSNDSGEIGNDVACDDDGGPCFTRSRIEHQIVAAGTHRWIRVSGSNGASGSFILRVSGPPSTMDGCDFRTPDITAGRPIRTTLSGASSHGESSCGSTADNPDIHYRFEAPYPGTLLVTTCGTHDLPGVDTGTDTVVSIHSVCPATVANQLACNDDGSLCAAGAVGSNRDSSATVALDTEEEVVIRVSSFGSSDPGDIHLSADMIPANDDCADAIDVGGGGIFPANNRLATNDGQTTCGSSDTNPDVWYSFTARCPGTLQVRTCGTSDIGGAGQGADTVLSLHGGCPGSAANTLACNDQVGSSDDPFACTSPSSGNDSYVETYVTTGQSVLIRVSTWSNSALGDLRVQVDHIPDTTVPASFRNGSFDSDGEHWCFVDEDPFRTSSVDFSSGSAVVTGSTGTGQRFSYIQQTFTTYDTAQHLITFDWAYFSFDNYDRARWDLVDEATGESAVGGPYDLTGVSGESGSVFQLFQGSGAYSLRLGSWAYDGAFGAGISTYDDVTIECTTGFGVFGNGGFDDPSGGPWCFTDESENGSVSFTGGVAVVTGGDDDASGATDSSIQQAFLVGPGTHELSFSWSYASADQPTYDGASWDLIDDGSGLSAVGGPIVLADADGASGVETATFTGPGQFTVRLGTFSVDNVFGPGVTTYDDVTIQLPGCDSVNGLTCSESGGTATLSWTNGAAYVQVLVRRNLDPVATLPGTATSFTDPGLAPGNHVYEVEPVCAGGTSAYPIGCVVTIEGGATELRRGDCNDDGQLNIADGIHLLGNLFPQGAPNPLPCRVACDANDDDGIDIADAISILGSLFGSPTVPLPAPYPACGVDPTPGALDCATSACP